jgi:curli biogenesis system outer membrane secretion channel CsgG
MNHRRMTLAIAAIVAAAALTTVAFAAPQQVMAYRHHHHHNDNHKSIKVDQQVNQENQCTGGMQKWILTTPQSGAFCINEGSNDATINH